ncbi:hypothetical protein [Streptomyces sp. NPDC058612]|uniref:hypothetical protein n=1 Tax=Streptomyces sp. NPDC058612 TaxID=3346555 RepID=UPI0036473ADB
MASYAKDPRCTAMADALAPLLRRNCPEGASGFGGSYQVNLDDEEAVGLGGVELIRAAMRKAARQLGWKVTTLGMTITAVGVNGRREAQLLALTQLSVGVTNTIQCNRCCAITGRGEATEHVQSTGRPLPICVSVDRKGSSPVWRR